MKGPVPGRFTGFANCRGKYAKSPTFRGEFDVGHPRRPDRAPGRTVAVGLAVGALALAATACGSGAAPKASGPRQTTESTRPATAVVPTPAGRLPSKSAKMICDTELQRELVYSLGVHPVTTPKPTWIHHKYTCVYHYGNGVLVLSVQELSSQAQTDAYFKMLGTRLGDTGRINGLGSGAFTTRNGSIVARKDWKVLLVDVSGLPHRFGKPSTGPAQVAVTVADSVLACWRGD